ncbi:MAG: hypothetical protein ABIT08_14000 [Bacteroidia bacterium]
MTEEILPDNSAEENEDNQQPGSDEHSQRRRRRVRKRIRIKKKASPKKKIRKYAEKIIWLLIIIGFIATLIIMVQQLNVVDEKNKKTKTSSINSFTISQIINS